jgi:tRNA-splicing ligase RtcB
MPITLRARGYRYGTLPDDKGENVPTRINDKLWNWASILEPKTREQAELTSSMPFVAPHLALMPDAHLGLGATVGSVIPTVGAIMPAAVGVDIGCGMIAVRTQFVRDDLTGPESAGRDLSVLRRGIERAVPLSVGAANRELTDTAAARIARLEDLADRDYDEVAKRWRLQLGTLGSGNHFIEVSVDELDRVWLFLHSGSRGIGNKLAQQHIAVARAQTVARGENPPDRDLSSLVEGTLEFDAYIRDLQWAQTFALLNREEMMDRVAACLATHMRADGTPELERINCHHNFTQRERHFGEDLWVSRKGAIQAKRGQAGLIPGSMGTASYVVSGLGNPESLESSPHGAGRMFSRSKARKTFTRAQLEESMQGIEWRHSDAFLDEIPAAYKDVDVVMADAADLVEVRHTLRQLVNVKGD